MLNAKGKRWHPRDVIVVCAVQARLSTESRAPHTNQIRTWFMSLSQGCSNVVLPSHSPNVSFMLIRSSPDFDVLNQQRVVVMTDFIRMLSGNVILIVFKSDAVFRWAAIFRTFLPRHLRGRCCTQRTDVPALVSFFCVQLPLERGATTPFVSEHNKIKNHLDLVVRHRQYRSRGPDAWRRTSKFDPTPIRSTESCFRIILLPECCAAEQVAAVH